MSTSTTRPLISADSHVNPPPTMWREYLPAEFRDRAPRLEQTPEGDFEVFEGQRKPILALNSLAGKKPQEYSLTVRRLEEQRPGGWDPVARLADMDLDGIEAEILYGGGPLNSSDPALRLASYAAYNDWLADFCAAAPSRLLGVAYIPFASMEGAVAEIRRTAQRGLRSALIPAVPPSGSWADPTWTPVWEALAELGLPAAFHVGFSFQRGARLELGSQFMTSVVMSKLLMAEPLVELIYSGVLARYPDVKLVAVEGQLGWIPFVIQYMDHIYEKHRYWTGVNLPEKPSVYFRRQVYATFMEDEVGIRERAAIGVDNILWSSDYPHSETTWPNSQKLLAEWLRDVPQPEVDKIVRENARALYHI